MQVNKMKKFLVSILVVLMLCPCQIYASEVFETSVSLCYGGDAYSVDYVFAIEEDTDVLSVSVSDKNCMFDWNYVKDEARLYLSLASGNVISKSKTIATIGMSKDAVLEPVSAIVNGNIKDGVYAYHTDGEKCENCGIASDSGEYDINGDGMTDVKDVMVALKAVVNEEILDGADVSGDGKITLIDVIRILKAVVK